MRLLDMSLNDDRSLTFLIIALLQCGHCKAMAPDWEKLAEEWKDHEVGMVAEIDCTAPEAEALCQQFGVEGFPTLKYGDPMGLEVRLWFW